MNITLGNCNFKSLFGEIFTRFIRNLSLVTQNLSFQELKEHCSLVLKTLTRSADARHSDKTAEVKSDTLPRDEHFQDTKEAMIAMVTGMSDAGDANKVAEQLCLIEMVRFRQEFQVGALHSPGGSI